MPSTPSTLRRTLTGALAALTFGTALLGSGGVQARGYGGVVAAGIIGGLALDAIATEAAPRRVRVVEHRYVRHGGKLHYCGCVVREVPLY